MGFLPHLWLPKIFFQKSGLVTFVPLGCPNFMQKIRKKQWTVSQIFEDGPTDEGADQLTDGQGRLLRTLRENSGSKMDSPIAFKTQLYQNLQLTFTITTLKYILNYQQYLFIYLFIVSTFYNFQFPIDNIHLISILKLTCHINFEELILWIDHFLNH